jgi:hypothetical protein
MKYTGRAYKAPSGQWSWAIAEQGIDIQAGGGYDDEDSATEAMEAELATYNEPAPSSETKSLDELIFGEENQKLAHEAVTAAVAHAIDVRRQMVDRVNQNQRLEGYEPDEQLHQLQERFIAGELTTGQMIEMLTDYAKKEVKKWPTPELTQKQFEITALVDTWVSELAFSGLTVDPLKIIMWKKYVIAGMEWETLLPIILNDSEKIVAVRAKQEFPDYPGMKSMGGGYYLGGDD